MTDSYVLSRYLKTDALSDLVVGVSGFEDVIELEVGGQVVEAAEGR